MDKNTLQIQSKVQLKISDEQIITVHSLKKLGELTGLNIERLPYCLRILLENILRNTDNYSITENDVRNVLNWNAQSASQPSIPFIPTRVVMQDFAGLPAIVDLATMRDAFENNGGDPTRINPVIETVLVIDHSLQVDYYGDKDALKKNVTLEFKRNEERYTLLKWSQQAFKNFKVVPPGVGIIHQVNLEYLAKVVMTKIIDDETVAFPDSMLGTDSHTTMVNSIGVMGWGVGGIEAEAVMLGQPYYLVLPAVIGVKLTGKLAEGVTATDLALTITQILRLKGVVEKFVEFYGPGVKTLSLPDRGTIANMAPEYGATIVFFPVDQETCQYLSQSNRAESVPMIKAVCRESFLYRDDQSTVPEYSEIIEIDLNIIDASLAGPKRPHDRIALRKMKNSFQRALQAPIKKWGFELSADAIKQKIKIKGFDDEISHGAIAIAAITSCTNTSNPHLMIGAGLIAEKAVKHGLKVKPYIKTSMAPGSQVVTHYLAASGLLASLEKLHFNVVGYGCTTCVGNSGALFPPLEEAINESGLIVSAVLSGNRNFEGRIHPLVKANYLASPMYVIAYALAGTVDFNFEQDPLGKNEMGEAIYLRDIWPSTEEIHTITKNVITCTLYESCYESVFKGTEEWRQLNTSENHLYDWQSSSTYIQPSPFFEKFSDQANTTDIINARVLMLLGDSVTTDHISPVGSIAEKYPAGKYLLAHGIPVKDFNVYGARRGNHEIMTRGTFANPYIRNLLLPGTEGGVTRDFNSNDVLHIYDAAMQYKKNNTPVIIIVGKDYGSGSARDWAAKGTALLGVKAIIAESYERIHRSNLVGMGILPLQFMADEGRETLALDGSEIFTIQGISHITPGKILTITAQSCGGQLKTFSVRVRLDNAVETNYYYHGGILPAVFHRMGN